ncbi:hypothetical protein ONE63_006234 [Megalurothrips usitatus]|uniref:C2H2-type domain-containing protein n=1 Tax=Megalurothrips usitatus TaxID=439358 RepID=A0AAV7XWQ7_9NEOP|nr:hypothetical protein ONE63_006234 [Megalurothrips usitatus]
MCYSNVQYGFDCILSLVIVSVNVLVCYPHFTFFSFWDSSPTSSIGRALAYSQRFWDRNPEDNGGLWRDGHISSIDGDISNDADPFSSLDEYYKHCGSFLDWGKPHSGFIPQHFEQRPTSSAPGESLSESKSYACEICGKVYKLSSSLYSHKKFECGRVPTFKCLFCPQRTFQKGSMKRHMKRIHNSEAAPIIISACNATVK